MDCLAKSLQGELLGDQLQGELLGDQLQGFPMICKL